MAQREIQMWADILNTQEAQDKAYEDACQQTLRDLEIARNHVEFDDDDIVQPESVGFLTESQNTGIDDDIDQKPSSRKANENLSPEDLQECGYDADGNELAEVEAEKFMNGAFHDNDEFASIELEIFDPDSQGDDGQSFVDDMKRNIPGIRAVKRSYSGQYPTWRFTGTCGDLKELYAAWLGLWSWDDVVDQGEESGFNEKIVFSDGDTLQEADYRERIAHALDPVGVHASTANLRKTNQCQMTIVKEAVRAEMKKRGLKRRSSILEDNLDSMSDEDLQKIDSTIEALDKVDDGTATDKDMEDVLAFLKSIGINSYAEYQNMDPKEYERRVNASLKPLAQANGFAMSNKTFIAHHRPDKENGGATSTVFQFNPRYDHYVSRAETLRELKKAQQRARDKQEMSMPPRGSKSVDQDGNVVKGTWTLSDFGKLLSSLSPKQVKELKQAMLDAAHEDNIGNPEAEAYEIMFIKKLFGQKNPTFRDIARAWYPGQDPNTRQQSVNKFCQDTFGNFVSATRAASGKQDGSLATFQKNILGNPKNFSKFLDIMKNTSQKRASNKRSIINRGKSSDKVGEDL